MALHKNLADAELHEPKGVVGAASGTSYIANGSGSGSWKKTGVNEIDRTNLRGLNQYTMNLYHNNINTANKSAYASVVLPGTLTLVSGVVDAPVTAETTITVYKNGITNIASFIIAGGSVEGSRFGAALAVPTAFVAGDFIKVVSSGGGTGTTILNATLLFNHTFT